MSIVRKISIILIFALFISYSICYAIDENQFGAITESPDNSVENVSISTFENTTEDSNFSTEESSFDATESTYSNQSSETPVSATVSSVSSSTNASTISNIINIALIVVGILLILLAIAILIRLQ